VVALSFVRMDRKCFESVSFVSFVSLQQVTYDIALCGKQLANKHNKSVAITVLQCIILEVFGLI